MSGVTEKRKRNTRKPKAAEPVAPQPIAVQQVVPQPVPEQVPAPAPVPVEPEPESIAEFEAPLPDDVPTDASAPADSGEKVQRKKKVYEDLKEDVDGVLNKLLEDISTAKTHKDKNLVEKLREYEKLFKRVRTNVKKVEPKEKRSVIRTQPSGFNKPVVITQEMATFAGWEPTELKSRTDVTNALCKYIKDNKLQRETAKREIVPDARLSNILRYDPNSGTTLTYSTMQKHLSHLFVPTPTQ